MPKKDHALIFNDTTPPTPVQKFWFFFFFAGLIGWAALATPKLSFWFFEGLSNYQGWLYMKGYARAYDTLRTESPPLAYFIHGFAQWLFGPSLLLGRIVSGFFFIVGSTLVALTARRLFGFSEMIFALFLSVFLFSTSTFFLIGIPYSFTMALVAGVCFLLARQELKPVHAISAVLLAFLAMLTEESMAIFIWWVLFYLFLFRGKKFGFFGLTALIPSLLLVIVIFRDRLGGLFHSYFQVYDASRLAEPAFPPTMDFSFGTEAALASKFFFWYLPLLIPVFLTFHLLIIRKPSTEHFGFERKLIGWMLLCFATLTLALAWGAGLSSRLYYALTAIQYLPLILIPACGSLMILLRWRKKLVILGLAICLLVSASMSAQLLTRNRGGRVSDLERIKTVGEMVARHTRPEDKVFSYGQPHFMLQAGRVGFPILIFREWGMAFDEDTEAIHELGYYSPKDLIEMLDASDFVLLGRTDHNRTIDHRAGTATSMLKLRLGQFWELTESLNPGDIALHGGRPVGLWQKKQEKAAQEKNQATGGE